MKYPKDKERLEQLLSHLNITSYKLSIELGYKSTTSVYTIERGEKPISSQMANKIVLKFPEINLLWLIGKESNMLSDPEQQEQQQFLLQASKASKKEFKSTFLEIASNIEIIMQQNATIIQQNKDIIKMLYK